MLVYKFSPFFKLLPFIEVLLLLCLLRLFNSSLIIEFSNSSVDEYSCTLLYSFSSDAILTKYFISLYLKFSSSSFYLYISSTNYLSIYKLLFNKNIFYEFYYFSFENDYFKIIGEYFGFCYV